MSKESLKLTKTKSKTGAVEKPKKNVAGKVVGKASRKRASPAPIKPVRHSQTKRRGGVKKASTKSKAPTFRPMVDAATHKVSDLRAAKNEWSDRVFSDEKAHAARSFTRAISPRPNENVTGVGIAEKTVNGKLTGIISVKFFVRLKYPQSQIERKHLLPKSIHGLPVDVEQVGVFRPLRAAGAMAVSTNPRKRIDPSPPGCSIGFRSPDGPSSNAGTFGALVTDGSEFYILSSNHVLAFANDASSLESSIVQPGLLEHDPNSEEIAKLDNFIPLQGGDVFNRLDCAIARVLDRSLVSNSIVHIGAPRGPGTAQIDMPVHKFGRTTEYRAGIIRSTDFDIPMRYEIGTFLFHNQIMIEALDGERFADEGDSGALVLERGSQKAVGLLMGIGTKNNGGAFVVANHLNPILSSFRVTLV
jgi:hypothetical protein